MTHWQVETGTVGGQKQMTLLPDCDAEDLSAIIEDGREVWTISGRRARFKSTAIQLPAGWYRVRGVMDCLDGGIMSPGLRAEYADINYVGARYGLSEPGEDGTLGALIMLGADVVGLTFLPGVAPATFRMHSFTLQRVSRWRALRLMLAHDRSDGSIWLTIKRSGRFLRNVLRDGVSQGGAALFGDYARRLSTRGSNDYATWIRRYERFGSSALADADTADSLEHFRINVAPAKAATAWEAGRAVWRLAQECTLLAAGDLFDARYYLRNNPDVAGAGIDPILHFCKYGWQSLRNPSKDFDVWWYWSEHLDPASASINPLVHYALVGRGAGLQTRPDPYRPRDDGQQLPAGRKIRRICLFAAFDPQGRVDDSVLDYLRELSRHADVYYLADCVMQAADLERARACVKDAWAIRHGAYDFGSYSLLARELVGWDTIESYDELILANDSCYLLKGLDEVFSTMQSRACDWWGMQATKGTWATRHKPSNRFDAPMPMAKVEQDLLGGFNDEYIFDFHLGSYFVAFRRPVIDNPGFRKRLDAVGVEKSKLNIIRKYEIGIGRYLMASGHRFATYIDALYPFHPVYTHWVFELIEKGFPFFKRYFLSENHYRCPGLLDWKERLLRLVPGAPVGRMEENLLRVSDYEKLYRNLRVETDRRGRPQLPALLDMDQFKREDARTPTHDDWWVFTACAFNNTFSGNERALFEEVKDNPSIKKIVLTRRKYIQVDGSNVVVLPLRSREGQDYLMRAKQIFIKHSPTRNLVYPLDRATHNIINVWHGIPLKRIGYASLDMQHKLEALGEQHRMCRAVISSSKVDTMAMASAFYPLSYNDIWLTGLPRNDFILREYGRLPVHLKEQYDRAGEQIAGRRLVLFVPTFKQGQRDAYYPFSEEEVAWLGRWLERNNAVLGVREHMADKARTYNKLFAPIGALDLGDSRFADVEVLYRHASLLITDYSSSFIDFMLTGRPMVSFAYDYDNYINSERGLFYDLDFAFPGPVCRTFDAMRSALDTIFDEPGEIQHSEYAFKRRLFFEHLDDRNAGRLVQKVLSTYSERGQSSSRNPEEH